MAHFRAAPSSFHHLYSTHRAVCLPVPQLGLAAPVDTHRNQTSHWLTWRTVCGAVSKRTTSVCPVNTLCVTLLKVFQCCYQLLSVSLREVFSINSANTQTLCHSPGHRLEVYRSCRYHPELTACSSVAGMLVREVKNFQLTWSHKSTNIMSHSNMSVLIRSACTPHHTWNMGLPNLQLQILPWQTIYRKC